MRRLKTSRETGRRAGVAAAVGFAAIAVFQAALALGAPLGDAAWGGADSHLSSGKRVGSAIAVVVWIAAALIVLRRAGLWGARGTVPAVSRWGTWLFAALTGISALVNFASDSPWERFILGPLALILAMLTAVVARSEVGEPSS